VWRKLWNSTGCAGTRLRACRIETDLRSLKRTVRLQHVAAKSKGMMEKELIMATAAYNLVRAVMSLAAERCKLDPRQLSFSGS
jgi:putative transposase